ncbi:MAG: TRAP transporter small permease [Syntrophobacteraceae bacterium]|jgi:TRAP-type C4-dicarboxylate transport system permease small subunit|nr:TRAP transporter small permease [Syntrophobacteraceae bacterium]
MSPPTAEVIRRAAAVYSEVERWTVVLLMVVLVLFALYQIVLRNFFFTGVIWGDNFLRHLVLWIGFLGACRATAEGKHIQIELHALIPEGYFRSVLSLVRIIFLTAVCAALFYASWSFVTNERTAGDLAFLRIPYWWLETIFPVSFLVMTLRSLSQLRQNLRAFGRGAHP